MDKMRLLSSKLYRDDIYKALYSCDLSFLNNKTILITGGLGLIGSAIVDCLSVYNEISVAGITIFVAGRNETIFQEKYNNIDYIHFINYDAQKPLSINFDIDYIIFGAGLASPNLYVSSPVETILSNFIGINNLLEYSLTHLKNRVLYISSSEVYGNKESEKPYVESFYGSVNIDEIRSSYSVAKRASEMLCKSYTSEYGIDTVIARPGHIFGPTASVYDQRVSSDFAYKAAKGETIVLKSSGLQKRSYMYSVDCAVAILTVLAKGKKGEAYNIANKEEISIREMSTEFAKAGNVNLIMGEPSEEEIKAFNPMKNSSLNNEKLLDIGYKPSFTAKDGIEHTVRILRELL